MRKMVREFALKEVAPQRLNRMKGAIRPRHIRQNGRTWTDRHPVARRKRRQWGRLPQLRHRRGGAVAGVCFHRRHVVRSHLTGGMATEHLCHTRAKTDVLRPMAEGKKLGAYADRTRVRVRRSGYADDGGTRRRQLRAQRYENFYDKRRRSGNVIVFAFTDPEKGHRGITAFIVEKGTRGFRFGKREKKLGIRSSPTV